MSDSSSETSRLPESPEVLRAEVATLLREDPVEIDLHDNLVDWGLDSIRLMVLAQRWRSAGSRATFAQPAERPQLSHWWKVLHDGG